MKAIIIGNASSILNHKNGNIINNFDKVIRLNKFVIKGFEDYVGTKTDIYCSKILNMSYNINLLNDIENVWFPYPKPPRWWKTKGNFKEIAQEKCDMYIKEYNIKHFSYLNEEKTKEIEEIFKYVCQPSTGLIAIMMAIQELPNYKLYFFDIIFCFYFI